MTSLKLPAIRLGSRFAKLVMVLAWCTAFIGSARTATAQNGMWWLEGGKHNSTYGDGHTKDGAGFGAGILFTIGGAAKKSTGLLLPIGAEFRANWGGGVDFVTTADIAIRVHFVSFGPGATLGFLNRSTASDVRCVTGPLTPKNSCFTDGTRDMGGFVALGVSGFTKVNFGPQGRAFAQIRYIHYPQGTMNFLSASEMYSAFNSFAQSTGTP